MLPTLCLAAPLDACLPSRGRGRRHAYSLQPSRIRAAAHAPQSNLVIPPAASLPRTCPSLQRLGRRRGIVSACGLLADDPADGGAAAVGPALAGRSEGADQQPDQAELQRQLAAARAEADGWRALHAQLHAYCVDQLLPAPS